MKTLSSFFALSGVKLLLAGAMVLGLMMLPMAGSYSQPTCANYCQQGYLTWTLGAGVDSVCFSLDDTAKVCMDLASMIWNGSAGCTSTATVDVTIFKYMTEQHAAPQNCNSPLQYEFQADQVPTTGNCPNGYAVQCCCLPPGNYYVKVLSTAGKDYSQCYSGYIRICFDCSNPSCP